MEQARVTSKGVHEVAMVPGEGLYCPLWRPGCRVGRLLALFLLLPLFLIVLLSKDGTARGIEGAWKLIGQESGITLNLRVGNNGQVTGTLVGGGNSFQIQGRLDPSGAFMGDATGNGLKVYMEAMAQGERLVLIMADYGRNGMPDPATARQLLFSSDPAGSANVRPDAGERKEKKQAAPPSGGATGSTAPASGRPGSVGTSAVDQQLAQVLLASRWCHFTYSQGSTSYSSGSSYQETVTLSREGIMTIASGSETYSSGWGGTFAGSRQGGPQQYYWRIQGGMLHISSDGANWTPLAMNVKLNSSGYPIFTVDGKEYSSCQ